MTAYSAHTSEDSKTLKLLLNDAAKFHDKVQWQDLDAFKAGMGSRWSRRQRLL